MAEPLFTKILVPVDFSPCSEEAFRVASTMARTFQAKILLLHVIDTGALATFNQLGVIGGAFGCTGAEAPAAPSCAAQCTTIA